MFGLGWQEGLLILLLFLLFFGAKRLPGIAKSMGRSVQEFKKGLDPAAKDDEEGEDGKLLEKGDASENAGSSGGQENNKTDKEPKTPR